MYKQLYDKCVCYKALIKLFKHASISNYMISVYVISLSLLASHGFWLMKHWVSFANICVFVATVS